MTTIKINITKYKLLLILSLVLLISLYIWHPNSLYITDIWFHLLLAKQSATQSLIPLYDSYTFQPLGRVQIYPPLLHIVIGGLSHIFSWDVIVHYLGLMFYIVFLIVLNIFSTYFWKERMALLITLAATLSLATTLTFFSLMPSAISMIFILGAYLTFYKKQYIVSVLLFAVTCYLHPMFPFLGMLGLFYYVKRYSILQLCAIKKVIAMTLLYALPWFLWVISHGTAFNLERFWFDNPLDGVFGFSILTHYDLNMLYIPLSLWGLYYTRNIKDNGLNLIRSLLYGFLPVLIFYGGRYTWHLMPFLNIFFIIAIAKMPITKKWLKKINPFPLFYKIAYTAIIAFIILIIPMPLFSYPPSFNQNSNFSFDLSAFALPLLESNGFSQTDEFKEVIEIINTTSADTIIVSSKPDLGTALSFYTDRGCDYGLYWENTSKELLDTIENYRETERPRVFIFDNKEIPYPVDNVYNVGNYTIGERF